LFEIAPIFLTSEEGPLPDEPSRLVIAMTGPRALPDWQGADTQTMDFYDLKGILGELLAGLRLEGARYEVGKHPIFHPGKCAQVMLGERRIGVLGELHPEVHAQYDFSEAPVLGAAIDLDTLIETVPDRFDIEAVPTFPPVLEDLAFVVEESLPAEQVSKMILQTGGKTVTDVKLFDVYRGGQVGAGKKSLAYSLTYQDPERTLTDEQVAKIRNKIVRRLEKELGAKLRAR
jgi:phenylalanyl-tRNA synthetase beta chain